MEKVPSSYSASELNTWSSPTPRIVPDPIPLKMLMESFAGQYPLGPKKMNAIG